MRKLDRPQSIIDHQFFDLVSNPCPPPHASCINQLVMLALKLEIKLNGIAGDASLGAGKQPVFIQKAVDQR